MKELFAEIFESLGKNKLRSFLTGFSIAWGIFMIVILLGAGNGLMNGMESNMGNMMFSRITVYPGYRNIPYKGFSKYSRIEIPVGDTVMFRSFDGIKAVIPNKSASLEISDGSDFSLADNITGTVPVSFRYSIGDLVEGRVINDADMRECRRVAVIDEGLKKRMFGDEDAAGKRIWIDKVAFKVVGVMKYGQFGGTTVNVPMTTFTQTFSAFDPFVSSLMLVCEDGVDPKRAEMLKESIMSSMRRKYNVDPADNYAIYGWSNVADAKFFRLLHMGLNMFIWMIGAGTLLAGIVGVSNIMVVSVRERTSEIGIRRTFGARTSSIVSMILLETLVITLFSGYIGMVSGVAVMEVVSRYMETMPPAPGNYDISFFKDPTLRLPVILSCTAVLVAASVIAGYMPARKAAGLKTIDALRYNK